MMISLFIIWFPYSVICATIAFLSYDITLTIHRRNIDKLDEIMRINDRIRGQIEEVSPFWSKYFIELIDDYYINHGIVVDLRIRRNSEDSFVASISTSCATHFEWSRMKEFFGIYIDKFNRDYNRLRGEAVEF